MAEMLIIEYRHPKYWGYFPNWQKWRDTYVGGDLFINKYLEKFSKRETEIDFKCRKKISYLPAFAKAAINEIKDSIFQRLVDIKRIGGPKSYQQAMNGLNGGVDNETTNMNTFIGQWILPELLTMQTVGAYVDMDNSISQSKADENGHPYIYTYCVEDILTFSQKRFENSVEFTSILLRDYAPEIDEKTQLPTGIVTNKFRHMWLADGKVQVEIYDSTGKSEKITTLEISKIPFEIAEISESLLSDVANYQIALLNVASSDLIYTLHSNFPFYTEQVDGVNLPSHLQGAEGSDENKAIEVGASVGRAYKKGMERPGFIHPSSEPLKASIEKQDKMKEEIRQLVQLAVSNLQPKMASAESKSYDNRGLEAGLSYIGLELERFERKIAEYWAMYSKEEPAQVNYPKTYALKTDADRRAEAKDLAERLQDSPSPTYRKEVCKAIAYVMLQGKIAVETLDKIYTEIDKVPNILNAKDIIEVYAKYGIIDNATLAQCGGFDEKAPERAAIDHAARLKRIQDAQTTPDGKSIGTGGVADTNSNPGDQKDPQNSENK